ncbi:uncharacterized protein Bfra_008795 [Botrytis fragariae]|uniref:Uncharacterized protein n=1 Tax=Botrytis fragariae TaxID=1964551 RepID=A0A8H6EGY4_9HELO|nr:uncharacterized protein Bfra_008795 [Botrytis fragariae]KAF5871771.1 hypothetical protein Bfra_008795 [Botrytis fragariae]
MANTTQPFLIRATAVQTNRIIGHLGDFPDRVLSHYFYTVARQRCRAKWFLLSLANNGRFARERSHRWGVLAPKIWAYENTISRFVSVVCDASKVPMHANVNSSI